MPQYRLWKCKQRMQKKLRVDFRGATLEISSKKLEEERARKRQGKTKLILISQVNG